MSHTVDKNRPNWTDTENALPMYAAELLRQAELAAQNAHAPYSKFKVGAALLLADGTISRGCNVENASFGATVCAERVAVWSAVAAGKLSADKPPVALAVTAMPCAMCLQVLSEFAGGDLPIFIPAAPNDDDVFVEPSFAAYRLHDLLPHPFELD